MQGVDMDSSVIAALIGGGATVATAAIAVYVQQRMDHASRMHAHSAHSFQDHTDPDLDDILERLERHHQRATFGAVAGLLGREPLTLFDGYPRTPRTSWVVSKSTGLPTGQQQ